MYKYKNKPMDYALLQFLNLIELTLLYLSFFGLSDIFVAHMKFNKLEKICYYLSLGLLGVCLFSLTIYL